MEAMELAVCVSGGRLTEVTELTEVSRLAEVN